MITILAGLGLGLSLIVAIGAQNAFVLRQGIRREHVTAVVLICAASDAVLIIAGVAGIGVLLHAAPWLIVVARWLGFVYLVGYGLLAARRAWRGGEELDGAGEVGSGADARSMRTGSVGRLGAVVTTALLLTWLNPHVYLDTVLMLGSIAGTHGDARWLFAAGAVLASVLWFTVLGYGASRLGRVLDDPQAWRIIDGLIAVIMICLGVSLVLPLAAG